MEQILYKKQYWVKEFYDVLIKGLRTYKFLKRCEKNHELSKPFIERIMLAVTEVNGCEVCSYAHTKIALEQGMDEQEIKQLLSGDTSEVPSEEGKAIMFAQHYAETKGHPSRESWEQIVSTYGAQTAMGILGAIRMIMIGNSYGIALSAFKSRIKGQPIEQSNVSYELRMMLSLIPLLPTAIIHASLLHLLRIPIVSFASETDHADVLARS